MKCFLHIGTEKTATTTIQSFFNSNRKKLLDIGYIYTSTAGQTNNRSLSVAAYNLDRRDGFTRNHFIDTNHELLTFQKKTIKKLEEEINAIGEDDSTIIFSSEHFQSRLTQAEELERLKEIIYGFGITDISVIMYLRRPAEIANSLYSTSIKSGNSLESPPLPSDSLYFHNVCDHKNTITKFTSVFGESAIIPRLFDINEFTNGSIVDDILTVIGITNRDWTDIPNANESLSFLGVELLRRLNTSVPRWVHNKPNHVRHNLVSYIEEHFSYPKYTMPTHLYEQYDLEFQESNNWVKNKYFPRKENLFSSKIPNRPPRIILDKELDTIADLIANIWNDKQNKIIKLTNDNN